MIRLAAAIALLLATGAAAQDRVVAVGGAVTEIVYALGQQNRLAARDTTSTWPAEAQALPDVGYMRALSPEGVLSTSPDLVLAEDGAGPPEALDVLKGASVPVVILPGDPSAEGIAAKIRAVGAALGVEAEAQALAAKVTHDLDAVAAEAGAIPEANRKRVLFILSTQSGRIMAAGGNTAADAVIAMAGGFNAVTGFEGYKPLTVEAVIEAAPDAILMMERGGGGHAPGNAELLAMPALSATPAAKNGAVVRMDGLYLLGFGPRTAQAVGDLNRALYGE